MEGATRGVAVRRRRDVAEPFAAEPLPLLVLRGRGVGFFVSPANAKSLDDIVKDGSLRIGINPNSPPFSQRSASGDFEGFDVTIGEDVECGQSPANRTR